jgi:DnaJ-class molecular chaperone
VSKKAESLPMIRKSDNWWRCAVCHGTGVHQFQSPKFNAPCSHCNGEGYKLPVPYQSTSTYHMK